jgi:hypothetical protein
VFVYNNPEPEGEEFKDFLASKDEIRGFVFQKEKGETNGTIHFQGYLELHKKKTTNGLHDLLKPYKMALMYAEFSKEKNVVYCTKEHTRIEGPWIGGTCLEKKNGDQGKRSDCDQFAMKVKEKGGIDEEVEEQWPGMAMRFKAHADKMVTKHRLTAKKAEDLEYWQEQYKKREDGQAFTGQKQRQLTLLFGPTAVGKTTHVKMEVAGVHGVLPFEKEGNTKWFDGYDGENHVLFDEMRKEAFGGRIEAFNAMTNQGVVQVEVKGATVLLECDYMWFTTNWHPTDIWGVKPANGAYRAFVRRFAEVHWWNDAKNKIVLKNPGIPQDTDEWKEANKDWWSFWTGHAAPVEEGATSVPGETVNYFTFGCNQ